MNAGMRLSKGRRKQWKMMSVCVEDDDKPAPAEGARESPVRRLGKKTAAKCEEVLCLGVTSSKEKVELDDVLERIKALQLAKSQT